VQQELVELADQFDLISTGGSDFHGPGVKSIDLGAVPVPPEAIEQLSAAAEAVRSTNFPSST
jgi:hypothetical protein